MRTRSAIPLLLVVVMATTMLACADEELAAAFGAWTQAEEQSAGTYCMHEITTTGGWTFERRTEVTADTLTGVEQCQLGVESLRRQRLGGCASGLEFTCDASGRVVRCA